MKNDIKFIGKWMLGVPHDGHMAFVIECDCVETALFVNDIVADMAVYFDSINSISNLEENKVLVLIGVTDDNYEQKVKEFETTYKKVLDERSVPTDVLTFETKSDLLGEDNRKLLEDITSGKYKEQFTKGELSLGICGVPVDGCIMVTIRTDEYTDIAGKLALDLFDTQYPSETYKNRIEEDDYIYHVIQMYAIDDFDMHKQAVEIVFDEILEVLGFSE